MSKNIPFPSKNKQILASKDETENKTPIPLPGKFSTEIGNKPLIPVPIPAPKTNLPKSEIKITSEPITSKSRKKGKAELLPGRSTPTATRTVAKQTPLTLKSVIQQPEIIEKIYDRISLFREYVPDYVNNNNIEELLSLKYYNVKTKKHEKYIIDMDRKDIMMEIVGMLHYQSAEDVIYFLTDAPNPSWVLWDQLFMDEGKIAVEREITIQQAEEVGVKGVGKCRYCNSNELVFAQKQLSSGDEAMKVFVRCVSCQKSWRQ